MNLFADNMDSLIDAVQKAVQQLQYTGGQPLPAGGFYHAEQIRTNVTGVNGDAGIKAEYATVLDDLVTGLTDISNGVRGLAKNYQSVEDANGMTSSDLADALASARDDFASLASVQGDSASTTSSGNSASAESSSGG
jgi:hypothetical protein